MNVYIYIFLMFIEALRRASGTRPVIKNKMKKNENSKLLTYFYYVQ
jgi:hypothetical protein